MRPIFFLCFCCVSVGYDHGKAYPSEDKLDDSIISFNYIEYMKARMNGMEDRPIGGDEIEL